MIKKVLLVISNISFGGAQRVTWTLSGWLKDNGVEPVVVALWDSTNQYRLPDGIKVIQLKQRHNYEVFRTLRRLRNVIRREQPSVMITMGVGTGLYSETARTGFRVPHIVSERNDPAHFCGKKWVITLARKLMNREDGFVFQTEQARDFYPPYIAERGRVIPNPLMSANIPSADPDTANKTIVTMGRLAQQKNHRMLLEAFHSFSETHPDYVLCIYGSGELKDITKTQIKELELEDKVRLHEACNDVLDRIKGAAFFVLSSDYEGMPNALIEAMAMGLPCISTDCPCGGPSFLIRNEENGVLVPVGDAAAMADAMCKLADDQCLRRQIGQEATKIRDVLSVERICKMWLDFCEETVHDK